jgi:hypothetical protein
MARIGHVGIRLEPEERDALELAAAADERTISSLARKIIVEWLRKNGWLKAEQQPGKAPRP